MEQFFSLLQLIFSNIAFVFKNFFHWTFSRLIIVVFAFILALLSFLPFLIILLILWFIDAIPWGEVFIAFATGSLNFWLISAFSSAPVFFIIETLIAIIWIAFAIGVYHYKEILLYKLIASYKTEERLKLRENISIKYLKRYTQIFPKIFLLLSLPVLWYLVYIIVVFLLAGWAENILATVQGWAFNYISILLLIGFVISALSFFYIYYRFIFIYPILALDEKEKNSEIFQTSRDLTRGIRIFLILWVIVLYAIALQPTSFVQNSYSDKSYELSNYYQLRLLEQIPKNESFLDDYGITDIDILSMQSKIWSYEFIWNIFYIFNFLVFYWIFEVVLFSIYTSFTPKKKQAGSRISKLIAGIKGKKEEL